MYYSFQSTPRSTMWKYQEEYIPRWISSLSRIIVLSELITIGCCGNVTQLWFINISAVVIPNHAYVAVFNGLNATDDIAVVTYGSSSPFKAYKAEDCRVSLTVSNATTANSTSLSDRPLPFFGYGCIVPVRDSCTIHYTHGWRCGATDIDKALISDCKDGKVTVVKSWLPTIYSGISTSEENETMPFTVQLLHCKGDNVTMTTTTPLKIFSTATTLPKIPPIHEETTPSQYANQTNPSTTKQNDGESRVIFIAIGIAAGLALVSLFIATAIWHVRKRRCKKSNKPVLTGHINPTVTGDALTGEYGATNDTLVNLESRPSRKYYEIQDLPGQLQILPENAYEYIRSNSQLSTFTSYGYEIPIPQQSHQYEIPISHDPAMTYIVTSGSTSPYEDIPASAPRYQNWNAVTGS